MKTNRVPEIAGGLVGTIMDLVLKSISDYFNIQFNP